MKAFLFFLSTLALLASCEREPQFHPDLAQVSTPKDGLPYYRGTVMDPYWPGGEPLPQDLRGLREFRLTTEKGTVLGPADTRGRLTLVYFFFTRCQGICPIVTSNVKRLVQSLDKTDDLQILPISVDPEHDLPPALVRFRADHGISASNWIFLTGGRKEVESLARNQFAAEVEARVGQANLMDFAHTENLFLLDKDGYLRGIYRMRGSGENERFEKELKMLRAAYAAGQTAARGPGAIS